MDSFYMHNIQFKAKLDLLDSQLPKVNKLVLKQTTGYVPMLIHDATIDNKSPTILLTDYSQKNNVQTSIEPSNLSCLT
jgi:hypothetical protein